MLNQIPTNNSDLKALKYSPTAEAMEYLVGQIMDLSKRELDGGLDMIDIGGDQTYTQDTNESLALINANGYSKVAKLNGLVSAKNGTANSAGSSQDRRYPNSCSCMN